ncbi:Presenilins-associated rhomboid-like protein, mitochondrial [Curvularia clavata]|uniref:Presenilins-associated rhomboid-like protein, mitochondrial n=1 Tax=Curvularia clavata TaxID=95742 RepID=A0A9Q9DSK2_CURCL|nr:Presenilins-associated rhomboid-like protein, mitochondrial [Curvularia clavata]
MSVSKFARPLLRSAYHTYRAPALSTCQHISVQRRSFSETRVQRVPQRAPRSSHEQPHIPQSTPQTPPQFIDESSHLGADRSAHSSAPEIDQDAILEQLRHVRVRYLRPALWAIFVSGGIFAGLSYLEAKNELKKSQTTSAGGWLPKPQWGVPRRTPPTPTEVVTGAWTNLDPISRLTYGIIGANSGVHLSSFLVPRTWDTLWHLPARNVNYTQFTSMFVHSGALHFFVNMYFLNNFMKPVGYSRLFEGSSYHTLSFFLSAGVLSGFAQHWSTLIPIQKRPIPEIFIRCGGASGALFGILGVFCMQYPHAGLGILFVPVHFEAQHVLPAIMLFDFIGMIRGYSFVNFGHAAHFAGGLLGVAYSQLDGKTNLWNPLVRFWKRRLQQQS